ncbi:MAG TPA: ATP-binding protein [Burkholderiales bacterium]|nr:ATP-binding protein [Burkholderiales bacterium]
MRFVKTTWLNSLSVKMLLAYVAGAALSIVLIALVVVAVGASQGDILSGADVAETTRDMAGELRFNSEGVPVGFDTDEFDPDFEWIFESMKQETAYRVLDASGIAVLSSAAGEAFWPTSGAARRLQRGRFEFEREGVAMHGATEAVEHNGKIWYLQFAASTRFLHLVYRAFSLPFMGAGITLFSLVLLFVFGACAYAMLRYTLKPLRELSDSAAAISPRSLHARLQTNAVPTEIAPLVDSFNRVLERLEQGYRIQQEFLSTAAHELKTPLALIRAQIELIEDGHDRSSLLNDVKHMTRQVQQLLLLAEASEVQNYSFTVVDVQEVAQEAANYLQRMADAADVNVVTPDNASGVQWLADRGALFTLFKNMLENAIQHAPPGTEVRVEVNTAAVSVRDWGPGVNQEQLSQIFSRFWRGAHRRDHGAGLGLTICQEIALAHGWTLSAHRANPGLRLCLSPPTTEQRKQLA